MGIFLSSKDINSLSKRVDQLETETRQLKLEWLSTYDKFRSILARIAKRDERLRAADESAGSQEAVSDERGSLVGPTASSLDPISQKILARRNRMRAPQ
jgi:hypothetical protein